MEIKKQYTLILWLKARKQGLIWNLRKEESYGGLLAGNKPL